MTCRAMMGSKFDVLKLQLRDLWKYGSINGPTFEKLVAKEQKRAKGDQVYENIIGSSQRTDEATNDKYGKNKKSKKYPRISLKTRHPFRKQGDKEEEEEE